MQARASEHKARERDKQGGVTRSACSTSTECGDVTNGDGGVEPGSPERAQTQDSVVEDGGSVAREEGLGGGEKVVERD